MEELDKLIRETDIEKTSESFTAEVMEKIRPLPVPRASVPVKMPVWFKLLMGGVFAGALTVTLLSMGNDPGTKDVLPAGLLMGIRSFANLFSVLQAWIIQYIWLVPSVLFSLAGFLFLLSWKPDLRQHYG